jgi:decaprenyl-phosphate phosphoribosyltransferase
MRFHQYIKNLFVFLPMFFGLRVFEYDLILETVLVFIAFCCVASAIYIFNDILDRDLDKEHPTKKDRPIVTKEISLTQAICFAVILLIIGTILAVSIGVKVVLWLCVYILLNILYSLKIKHIAILDVFFIASGFLIRLFVGAIPGNIVLSNWILVMTFLLALFLAFSKRRSDVIYFQSNSKIIRKSIDKYSLEFLNYSMVMLGSVVLVAYLMYTTSTNLVTRVGSENLMFTSVFVLLGILRYLQLMFLENITGSPTKVLIYDPWMPIIILGWAASWFFIIYV